MKTWIEVTTRAEGQRIRRALQRQDLRALVNIIGTLDTLPSERAQRRVLASVVDRLEEEGKLSPEWQWR